MNRKTKVYESIELVIRDMCYI